MRKLTGKIVSVIVIPFLLVMMILIVGCQGDTKPASPEAETTTEAKIEAEPEASPSPTETEEAMPVISKEFTRRSRKDPFMPVVGKKGMETAAQPTPVATAEPDSPGLPPPPGDTKEPDETVDMGIETPKPKKPKIVEVPSEEVGVEVRGILKTGGSYRAILTSNGGASYVVTTGQKVGEWKVSSISGDSVVLTAKGYKAKLPLQTEDLSTGEGASVKKSTEGPKLPAAPTGTGGEDLPPPPE